MKKVCLFYITGSSSILTSLYCLAFQRGDDKRNGDIVPPIPFYMRPSGTILYLRRVLGRATLLKHARCPLAMISVKSTPESEREGRGGREGLNKGRRKKCSDSWTS